MSTQLMFVYQAGDRWHQDQNFILLVHDVYGNLFDGLGIETKVFSYDLIKKLKSVYAQPSFFATFS